MVPEGGGGDVLALVVAGCGCGRVARAAVWRDLALRQAPLRPRRRRSRQAGDAQPQHPQGRTRHI